MTIGRAPVVPFEPAPAIDPRGMIMFRELSDLALLWAALMIVGGIAVLLWLLIDWLINPGRADRPPAVPARDARAAGCVMPVGRLGPGDPDNSLRGVPVIPGRGSRLVSDDEIAVLEQWLRAQTPA